jgi:PAS domain S-box-containing protein
MAVTIHCIHCGKPLLAALELAGRRVRCTECQGEFVLPVTFAPAGEVSADRNISPQTPLPGAHDITVSRSRLLPMLGMGNTPRAEMVCRLEPYTLRWLDLSEGLQKFVGAGIQELRGRSLLEFLHSDDCTLAEDEFRQAAERGERHDFVLRLRGRSAEWHYLRIYTQARYEPTGSISHIRCSLKDVTAEIRAEQELRRRTDQLTAANEKLRRINRQLKEAQIQLIHSEKLAALGTLAAGMAHEINNPLSFSLNNVAVLQRDVGFLLELIARYADGLEELRSINPERAHALDDLQQELDLPYLQENLPRLTESARDGLRRVAAIVQNLRDFVQLDRAEIGEVDINAALDQSLGLLAESLNRQQIAVVRRYAEIPPLEGAGAQLNQLFLNLLLNAVQAIEAAHRPMGLIEVATRLEGDTIVVEIVDNGCGIPDEIRSRIFDPFYTTKPVGRGTGMGLTVSLGIAVDHGGSIEVESHVGSGSRFRVLLPLCKPAERIPGADDAEG